MANLENEPEDDSEDRGEPELERKETEIKSGRHCPKCDGEMVVIVIKMGYEISEQLYCPYCRKMRSEVAIYYE